MAYELCLNLSTNDAMQKINSLSVPVTFALVNGVHAGRCGAVVVHFITN